MGSKERQEREGNSAVARPQGSFAGESPTHRSDISRVSCGILKGRILWIRDNWKRRKRETEGEEKGGAEQGRDAETTTKRGKTGQVREGKREAKGNKMKEELGLHETARFGPWGKFSQHIRHSACPPRGLYGMTPPVS